MNYSLYEHINTGKKSSVEDQKCCCLNTISVNINAFPNYKIISNRKDKAVSKVLKRKKSHKTPNLHHPVVFS